MKHLADAYVFLWVGSALMTLLGLSVVFVWAWRAGQFSDQGRARYLALWAEVPADEGDETGRPGAADKNETNDQVG